VSVQLLIPAAGMGQRLGLERPKALVEIAGEPMLVRTLRRLDPLGLATDAVIIIPPGHGDAFRDALGHAFESYSFELVDGGAERQQSVANGLARLKPDTKIVVIHDAARPFVPGEAVTASIQAARECGAATVAIPVSDTILVADKDQFLQDTPDRRALWACQTPQTFQVPVIREAHASARGQAYTGTDDASLVRRTGRPVKLVMGSALNFKITTPADLAMANALAATRQ
jgi:2-C-methyl-D-erythritol 4-phosphate cytidylyltransferase